MKIKVGDIVEIKTSRGLAYAIFTHKHPRYGVLLRVFDGFFESRPSDLAILASRDVSMEALFPLQAAVDRGNVGIVGNLSVPLILSEFPTFRAGMVHPLTGKVKDWWLWNGTEEWRIGELSNDQRNLPIRGVWNDTLLIQRLENGWRPVNDLT